MKTGTGGLKDGDGVVLIVCNSEGEGEHTLRQYRAVDQDVTRFDIIPDLVSAELATAMYPAGTKWCIPSDVPAWFSEIVRVRFQRAFGPQIHTSQAFACTVEGEYAIDPKLLRTPVQ